ncbi:MAG: DUF2891 domain-containing protein [Candidatus Thermoplasmatota archaeon]|nr:DUF2891 domain-containing protein [Candidatus Thermoplasmatota archaeon]MBS3790509.1 DUF2891 domain-containing protein [Candidatus Thermoplasmatota archaeon]
MDKELLERLAEAPLECIEKQFPHFIYSISSLDSVKRPKEQHPIFYGCFDWHSAVHSHWSLVRQIRLIEEHPLKNEIIRKLEESFSEEKTKKELAYFEDNEDFEKPYGWAWFMSLIAELHLWEDERASQWEKTLSLLEDKLLELIEHRFLEQKCPLRVGTHGNSAFALQRILDYSRVKGDEQLEEKVKEKSIEFFQKDEDAPAEFEPIGWDFLSPTLIEADLMRRILDKDEFLGWFNNFLPNLDSTASILKPIEVDLDELMKYHLVGLNISRSWCLSGIGSYLPKNHDYKSLLIKSAKKHAKAGVDQAFVRDYGGSHWLLSYALYLFTRKESGIAP